MPKHLHYKFSKKSPDKTIRALYFHNTVNSISTEQPPSNSGLSHRVLTTNQHCHLS